MSEDKKDPKWDEERVLLVVNLLQLQVSARKAIDNHFNASIFFGVISLLIATTGDLTSVFSLFLLVSFIFLGVVHTYLYEKQTQHFQDVQQKLREEISKDDE